MVDGESKTRTNGDFRMTQVLIDRAALELVLRTALAQQGDPVAYSQFLTDVVTAAGLLEHGRRDKGLAQRIADYAFSARSNLYTAAPAPQAQPVAQPLTNSCHTCDHYQQGKRPGVSIHDDTCYGCSEYYANKWEAKT